jgi:hypothetical protein
MDTVEPSHRLDQSAATSTIESILKVVGGVGTRVFQSGALPDHTGGSGKSPGQPQGYHRPPPRLYYPVVIKGWTLPSATA